MTEYRVPLLDPETGKLPADLLPEVEADGGPQCLDFGFAGTLAVRTGVQYWLSPAAAIRLVRLSAVIGTLPTPMQPPQPATFRVMLNGSAVASVSVQSERSKAVALDAIAVPAGSYLSVDITAVPASTPSVAGDAVVQLWWEYA